MRRIWKKAFSGATALLVCMSSAASQFGAGSIVFAAEEPTVEIGTVCLTLDELKANDYQVSVPVTVEGSGGWYLLAFGASYAVDELTCYEVSRGTCGVNNDDGKLWVTCGEVYTVFEDGNCTNITFTVNADAKAGDVYDITVMVENEGNIAEIITADGTTQLAGINGHIIIESSVNVIASGVCGETDVSWVLDTEGTLTLSGTGSHGSYAPWLTNYRNDIERVVIESGVTNVGYSAFGQCPNLKNVTIADTVTEIDDYAFYGCEKLTEIVIPDSVTSVGDYAFIDCTSLEEIVIPENVTSLGTQAFNGCDALTDIYFINPDCEIYDSAKSLPESAVLYGSAGSTAEAYAYTYDREFVEYTLIASGACGDRGSNVIWKLDSAGKLIVSGNGDMEDGEMV